MAKRKATARRRPTAAAKRAAAPKRRASARKATARKATRKVAKSARPAAKRKAKKTARKAAPKASTVRLIRRVTKKAAAPPKRKAAARKSLKKLVKRVTRQAPKAVKVTKVAKAALVPRREPSPAPVRAMAAKPKGMAAAGKKKHAFGLDRERRVIQDDDIVSPTPPSSLGLDRSASAARTGRQELKERYEKHNETSPALTGGDVDADWESAYSVGDETPGGDNPTPDQNVVDDIAIAVGNEYQDNEELEGADKIVERDRHRWEFDPASSEDFEDR